MHAVTMFEAEIKDLDGARAVLVGIILPGVTEEASRASLDELERLASTLGLNAVTRLTQRRPSTGSTTVLGAGKLRELARWTDGTGVVPLGAAKRQKGTLPKESDDDNNDDHDWDETSSAEDPEVETNDDETGLPGDPSEFASVVLFDQDLTPSQLRNIEGATSAEVLDRSSLILRIFQRHARTREARVQVEIAQLKYLAPRLRAVGASSDRQRGGIGGKGAGESKLELDRRRVRDRIAELEQRLVALRLDAQTRRARRSDHQTVALIGYTNAGKSSLMRRLTASDVLVKDQLFATLDTTVRQLQPPIKPAILVSDTVGFIKQLPHDLVASFRSTLEEAGDAALILHVIDASDPDWRSQLEVTHLVLREIGAMDNPMLQVFNKVDCLEEEAVAAFTDEFPQALMMSALRTDDIVALHGRIVAFFEHEMIDAELFVPYEKQRFVHAVHEACRVISEEYDEDGTRIFLRASSAMVGDLRKTIAGEEGVAGLLSAAAPVLE